MNAFEQLSYDLAWLKDIEDDVVILGARSRSGMFRELAPTFCSTDQTRIARYVREKDRDARAAANLLLRSALAARYHVDSRDIKFDRHCSICGNEYHGKPRSSVPGHFSVSRSGDRVVIALSKSSVGVDYENQSIAVTARSIRAVCTPSETELLRASGDAAKSLWVAKEAVGKLLGVGLVGIETYDLSEHLRSLPANSRGFDLAGEDVWLLSVDWMEGRLCVAVAQADEPTFSLRLVDGLGRSHYAGVL